MSQLRRHSAAEATLNTASGFVISYLAGFIIFPLVGLHVNAAQNFGAVLLYTVISVIRSYFWRRVFNWWQHRPKAKTPLPPPDHSSLLS